MKFIRPNNGLIGFSENAEATLLSFRQMDSNAKEAGGMLLGRMIDNCFDIVIDEATTPLSTDKRGRFFFFRGRKEAQKLINDVWFKSGATRIYLGEWHTHPEDDPTPSGEDLDNWRRIVSKAIYEQESLLFVIVGRNKTRLWEMNKMTNALSELNWMNSQK
jgi:integrative and conjugative element protein (TIGR02256 family)